MKEETKLGIVQALWNYIKHEGLQDKLDRKTIRADAKLRPVSISLEPDAFLQLNSSL